MARKKKAEVVLDDEDDDLDDAPAPRKPKKVPMDAYVGLLAITFVALATAAGLFYMDFEALNAQSVSPPNVAVPELGAKAGG